MALLITPRALAQRGEFYYQLSSMIRAGLPIIGALQTVEKSPPSAAYRKPVARMLTEAGAPPPVLTAGVVIGSKRAEEIFERAYDDHAHRLARLYENVGKSI